MQFLTNHPWIICAAIIAAAFVVTFWPFNFRAQLSERRERNRRSLRPIPHGICGDAAMIYDLLMSAQNKYQLDNVRNMIDTFEKSFAGHHLFSELHTDLIRYYNQRAAELMPPDNDMLVNFSENPFVHRMEMN